ncbi:MAG: hypothetical protein KC620_04020 [Myxococcales bacterium]|nr:hypothetical protein [Myxococcales bacterium]
MGEACTAGVGACAHDGARACAPDGEVVCDAVAGPPAPELCDAVDNDCDGNVDEGLDVGAACDVGVGICARRGAIICDADGAARCDGAPGPSEAEACNGLDDDCDGNIDEDFGVGGPCTEGVGVCLRPGNIICGFGDIAICDARAGVPERTDTCNGLDDDCDGNIDENIRRSGICQTGLPGRCRDGAFECIDGERICTANDPGEPEACNAADDDCDGTVDEDTGTELCGEGICQREVALCQNGQAVECDPFAGALPRELCNGLDDDCDGTIDEAAAEEGLDCGAGQGGCRRRGTQRCEDGVLVCDAAPGQPAEELCNNIDDDCDGATDEQLFVGEICEINFGPCVGRAQPVCQGGQRVCPAVQPNDPEICDGVDNNCDGQIDEGFQPVVCGLGVCRHVASCDGAAAPDCDPLEGAGPELCDGLDNDCDGTTDEDVAGLGQPCTVGLGECQAPGQTICRAGQRVCDGVPLASRDEVCNGLDDDCDGVIDDNPRGLGDPCEVGRGECLRAGAVICVDGRAGCDAVAAQPGVEVCNGLDDDCDGTIDDSLPAFICGQGICARELPPCINGNPPACNPTQGASLEECNGQDDDCDGITDEDTAGAGCIVGLGECRRIGVEACVDGDFACDVAPGDPQPERCDDLDNDCDGGYDEGLGRNQLCSVGRGLCQAFGRTVCGAEGDVVCDAQPFAAEPEACNGLDDDCDGATDEQLNNLGACATGETGACGAGVFACQDARRVCVRVVGPTDEVCDGADNDCDSSIDEDLGTQECGVGRCHRTLPVCDLNGPVACDPLAGAVDEVCNGIDDDCDGRTDEAVPGDGGACSAGLGVCRANGTQRCIDGAMVCDAVPADGQPEENCNLLDDDCDGTTDEETLEEVTPCFAGVGECRTRAFFTCTDGQVACPAQAGAPGPEICDVRDNDCDGQVDEDFGQEFCGEGICRHVLVDCNALGDPVECHPFEGARDEECNGLDDDCDGVVDEDSPGVGTPCAAGTGACYARAAYACIAGELTCLAQPGQPQPELCNNIDDDCDSVTDEDPTDVGAPCAAGVGACRTPSNEICSVGRLVCPAVPGQPSDEACNLVDDDCDGNVDEALGTVSCGRGVCQRDVPACVNGGPAACDPFVGAGEEVCNGADDDCDGNIDENQGSLRCGRGVCQREVPRCLAGQINVCNPLDGADVETCDNRDNDCDGEVDEEVPGDGEQCATGEGRCFNTGTRRCFGGVFVCDAQAGEPEPERCNGADDDCDGINDEDTAPMPQSCTRGVGACRRTEPLVCEGGLVFCRVVPGDPVPEVCNNVDDDCDGLVDEEHGGGDCDANGFDDRCDLLLRRDTLDCNNNGIVDECDINAGTSADCNQNLVPDECNGDGAVCVNDPEPPVVVVRVNTTVLNADQQLDIFVDAVDNVGILSTHLYINGQEHGLDPDSRLSIVFGRAGLYELEGAAFDFAGNSDTDTVTVRVLDPNDVDFPTIEIDPLPALVTEPTPINGRIDDANLVYWEVTYGPPGQGDQNRINQGGEPIQGELATIDPATIGEGVIEIRIYAEDVNGRSRTLTVQLTVGQCDPQPEVCDYGDNDCDGLVDEGHGNVGAACFIGLGACRSDGTVRCLAGGQGSACDAAPINPEPERCDGTDHDCDGNPTNGFPVGQPCSAGVGACQRDGAMVCNAAGDQAVCSATAGDPIAELCNLTDDDCDGSTDEGFGDFICGLGACAHVVSECNGGVIGQAVCDPFEGALAERCNGIDDDCDGRTDEDPVDVGNTCRSGLGLCARVGTTFCLQGAITCDARPGSPDFEDCNRVDDDCDGRVDEGGLCADVVPPFVLLVISAHDVSVGEGIVIQVIADDDQLLDQVTVDVNGEPVVLNALGVGVFVPAFPGDYTVTAVAPDAAGNETSDRETFTASLEAPVARFTIAPTRIPERDGFNSTVVLDASASTGGQLVYQWQVPGARVVGGALDEPVLRVRYSGSAPANVILTVRNLLGDDVAVGEVGINHRPVARIDAPARGSVGVAIAFDGSGSSDADGDPLAFRWQILTAPDGSTAALAANGDQATLVPDIAGAWRVLLFADDGTQLSEPAERSFFVDGGNDLRAPTIQVGLDPQPVITGQPVTITVVTNDASGIATTVLIVDGEEIPLVNGQATFTPEADGRHTIVVEVTDRAGNSAAFEGEFYSHDGSVDNVRPQVAITSPAEAASVRERVDVIGTASAADLSWYGLEVSPRGANRWTLMAEGNVSVVNGLLGTLDLIALDSGMWDLRLRAVDTHGNAAIASTIIEVQPGLHFGSQRFEFIDAEVEVARIPLTIYRIYDSGKKVNGEFGIAWSMDVRAGRLELSNPPGEGWNFEGDCVFRRNFVATQSHVVTVHTGAEAYRFYFNPIFNGCGLGFQQAQVRFTALPGTNATLTAVGPQLVNLVQGIFYEDDFFTPWEPQEFDLTLPDGRPLPLRRRRRPPPREPGGHHAPRR